MDFLNISTLACVVASKGLPRMMGIRMSSTISDEFVKFISRFSTIPLGVHFMLSAILIIILIGSIFPMPNRLYKEKGMMLMLAPKSANAFLKSSFPMKQWGMKRPGVTCRGDYGIGQ
ncbi:hypothetical protein Tco_0742012 [Tanacetum coccineum]